MTTDDGRTHAFGNRCIQHDRRDRFRCSCGTDHGTIDQPCGQWCPDYQSEDA